MLRITVEIIPFGDEREKSTLDIMEIINIGGDVNLGNYKIRSNSGMAFGLRDYPRRQGFWNLIMKALLRKETLEFKGVSSVLNLKGGDIE